MKLNHLYETSLAVVLTIALVIGAAELYWVRELLVALLIFALISAVVWILILAVTFLQQAARKGFTNFERSLVHLRARMAATPAQVRTRSIFR